MDAAAELYNTLANMPVWLLGGMMLGSYVLFAVCLKVFLRPAIVSALDPLNLLLFTNIVPALVGFVLVPLLTHLISGSFFWICGFLVCWLTVMRAAGKPGRIRFEDGMGVTFPTILLWLILTFTVLNVIVNMIIPGTIPLFDAGGAAGRFEATSNSRVLTWLGFGTGSMAGVIYALTTHRSVRRLAVVAVGAQAVVGLLFASKGGILIAVFILLNALFVARQRGDEVRVKKLGKVLRYGCMVIAPLVPVYLVAIGVGSDSSLVSAVGLRFLHGLDQLIVASQFDLFRQRSFGSALGSSIVEYQLMPFFKAAFGGTYTYSNIGQYVVEAATGVYIEGPYTFPNSNLILESVFTSGKYLGAVVFVMEMGLFYWARVMALRERITPWSMVAMTMVVFAPTGLFLDGQGWVVNTVLVGLVVLLAMGLTRVWRELGRMTQYVAANAKRARTAPLL